MIPFLPFLSPPVAVLLAHGFALQTQLKTFLYI